MVEIPNLHQLLTRSAALEPDHPAVESRGEILTYGELLAAAERLAATLAGLDLGPGDRVALVMDKSVHAVVGLYGILGVGAAYVPVDATSPASRLRTILDDCEITVVVSGHGELARQDLAAAYGPERTVLAITGEPDASPSPGGPRIRPGLSDVRRTAACPASREDLAYILYTSGSTGRPKGVMLTHGAALAFVEWAARELRLGPADRMASHAAFTFDLSILDLFGASISGACLHLVPEEVSLLPRAQVDWLMERRISVLYAVPWAFIQILKHLDSSSQKLEDIRLAIFAGEVFPTKHLRDLMTTLEQAEFYNLYGPTETNVCAFYRVPGPPPSTAPPVPIGLPCSGDELVVIDGDGGRVDNGQEGELAVAGPSVMSGYWGDPERTTAAFVDIDSADGPLRAYRTGDRVVRRADGNLLYLGREDRMVKRRGFRIELNEIESALLDHGAVREGAVVAEAGAETAAIRAFVLPEDDGERPGLIELKGFLAARIPRYMIPDTIEVVDDFPRTATGKIDRRRLTEQ